MNIYMSVGIKINIMRRYIVYCAALMIFFSGILSAETTTEFKGEALEIPRELLPYVSAQIVYKNKNEVMIVATIVKPRIVDAEKVSDYIRTWCLPKENGKEFKLSITPSLNRELPEKWDNYNLVSVVVLVHEKNGMELPEKLRVSLSAFGYQKIVTAGAIQ